MTGFPWKAVAWDIDGTLIDSEPLHHRALLATCAAWGLDLSALPESTFVGTHLRDVWTALRADLGSNPDAERSEAAFYRQINRHYAAGADSLAEIAGARRVVHALEALGVIQVCASNSDREVVDTNLAVLGIAGIMRGSVSLDDVREGKPAPEPYLRAAVLAGVAPSDVLVVEDSLTGTKAALAAGMRVALLVSPDQPEPVGEVRPDYRITALEQIPALTR
ncbi:HAD family hydrolase [Pseudogemmobacter bohemicus]|uniref:HAD family hydrolase n=1 Tax=Pseudogemmobacter bohemicus TaxID=2250708 RepID=UPI000DD3BC2E|nr:HAD family phosphatase [Pseudogemmobacter bohemicus]